MNHQAEQNDGYIQYQGMTNKVAAGLGQLVLVCDSLKMDGQSEELKQTIDRLNNHVFSLGVMGEFKRGKSTMINALLGQEILPADPLPCSATLNYVRWDTEKRAEIRFKDGTIRRVPFEELEKYVTKITQSNAANAANVDSAAVYCPCILCQNGVQIVDTPGLNDDERMTEISEKVIPSLDVIVMIISAMAPFGESEACFVREKVMSSDLGRIVFVVNMIDLIDEDDRPRLMEAICDKIKESVLKKMESVYGADSEEYRGALNMVGQLKVIPVSAKNGLKGKMKNDLRKIEESNYKELEMVISDLLTSQRGMLELVPPVKKVFATVKEATNFIEMRRSALSLSEEEFRKVQQESKAKIRDAREKKATEIAALKLKGKQIYGVLQAEIDDEYAKMEAELRSYVDQIAVPAPGEKTVEKFSEEVQKDFNAKVKEQAAIATERLNVKINDQLGKDVEKLGDLGEDISTMMESIQLDISTLSKKNGADMKTTILGTVVDAGVTFGSVFMFDSIIPGVGGLITGYRNGGIKGAAIGGLTGAAASLAVMSLLGPLGIVGLPLVLICGTASSVAGGVLTKLIFGKGSPKDSAGFEKIKKALSKAVDETMQKLREEAFFENWLKNACESTYEKVSEDIDRSWEASLSAMEQSLQQIQTDLTKNEVLRQETERDLAEMEKTMAGIMEDIRPVWEKVNKAIS